MSDDLVKAAAMGMMRPTPEFGANTLPKDAQEKLAEFLNWLDTEYETTQGTTDLFWELSHLIGNRIKNE